MPPPLGPRAWANRGEPSAPSQAKEDTTEIPIRCFVCCGNPATRIPIGGHLGQVVAFCSERCAAIHGLRVLRDSEHRWCHVCNVWSEEDGKCPFCGVRWRSVEETNLLDDGPFEDDSRETAKGA